MNITKPTVKIKVLDERLDFPTKATEHASGFDLRSTVDYILMPQQRVTIKCGIAVAIPPGYEGQVRGRSGIAAKAGIGIVNGIGTIDADYRGEIGVILINTGEQPFVIERNDRIAQLIIAPVPDIEIAKVDELDTTERGTGGFGHTGKV